MGTITLNRQMFGSGYTGSIEVPAGLSWMDSMAIRETAVSASQTSAETRQAREAVEDLQFDIGHVADAIGQLEQSLGLKLDAQVRVLKQQSTILEEVRNAVLNPEKTRAAERLADATQLLDHERYERALTVAEEGIQADANNPNLFFVAGWALVAMERFEEAQGMFEEARDASRGDQRSLGCRQAARSAFLVGKTQLAYELCRDARAAAAASEERAAVSYDIAVYAWATGDQSTAIAAIEEACREDSRHAERALLDPALERAPEVRDAAARVLREVAEEIRQELPTIEGKIVSLREKIPAPPVHSSRAHAELKQGVLPPRDWQELHGRVKRMLAEVEQAISEAKEKARLQTMVAVLDSAEPQLSKLEAELLDLSQAIQQHDDAVSRQDRLTEEMETANQSYERWGSSARLRQWVSRHRGWIWIGIGLSVVGLLIPGLLLIGLLILGVIGLMYGVGVYAERRQESERQTAARIAEELGRPQ